MFQSIICGHSSMSLQELIIACKYVNVAWPHLAPFSPAIYLSHLNSTAGIFLIFLKCKTQTNKNIPVPTQVTFKKKAIFLSLMCQSTLCKYNKCLRQAIYQKKMFIFIYSFRVFRSWPVSSLPSFGPVVVHYGGGMQESKPTKSSPGSEGDRGQE